MGAREFNNSCGPSSSVYIGSALGGWNCSARNYRAPFRRWNFLLRCNAAISTEFCLVRKIWSRKVAWSLSRSDFYRNRRLPRSKAGQIWLFEKNMQSFLSYLSSVYVVKKLDKVFSLIILRCFIDYHCSFVSSHCFYFLKKLGKFIGIRRYIVIKDTDVFWSADPLRVMRERIV